MLRALLVLALTVPMAAQWQVQQSNTTADLRGIHSLGNGIAWASGSKGTVLRTTDNGTTWQPCTIPPGAEALDFRGIQAFDAQTAIVMSSGKGDLSRLYKTTDACQTWKLVFTNPDPEGFWDAMQFRFHDGPSPAYRYFNGGVLVGDPVNGKFIIYKSDDYGDSWHLLKQDNRNDPAFAKKDESLFAASNSSVTATANNASFAFVTGGKSNARLLWPELHGRWHFDDYGDGHTKFTALVLPIPSSETAGAFAIHGRAASNPALADLMIVGGDYKHPEMGSAVFIQHKSDHSQRVITARTPPHGYRSAVAYLPEAKTWITVGPNGTDVSTDDGRNWHPLTPKPTGSPDEDQQWNALSLPFVVGPKGRIGLLRPEALKP